MPGTTASLDRQRQVFALLADVVDLAEDARQAALASADPTIAAQVSAMLEVEANASGGLLDPGQLAAQFAETEVPLPSDRQVGPYRVVEAIGVGGMGTVYLAEQDEPVRRRVALKVLRTSLDQPEIRQRFALERHAMGRLDHPNIAKILDAGITRDGAPYLAMEHIEGEPITAFCDQRSLSIEGRLRLFVQVCRGVEHAHQRFLLHRDIKPSNVLVNEVDGRPVPKLIDFGIVKWLDGSGIEAPTLTGQRILGTPHYMSPEALGLGDEPDNRSDVFSLGVLLYELLTGHLPWGTAETALATMLRRRLRDGVIVPPSQRLAVFPEDEKRRFGTQRGMATTTWSRRLRGDLDAIVSKAIAADVEERYDSARSLASEIERHLEHRPILARRAGHLVRLRKGARRHWPWITLIVALALGSVGTTLGLLEARRQTHEALSSRDESEQLTELLVDLLRDARPGDDGTGLSAAELLDRGQRLIASELDSQPLRRARLQRALGVVYSTWGLYDDAEPLLTTAVDTSLAHRAPPRDLLRSQSSLTWLRLRQGRFEEARVLAEEALVLADSAPGADPVTEAGVRVYLGSILLELGDLEGAQVHLRKVLEEKPRGEIVLKPDLLANAHINLAAIRMEQRDFEDAERLYRQALELKESVYGPEHRKCTSALSGLARAYYRLRRFDDAEVVTLRMLEIKKRVFGEQAPQLTGNLLTLGNIQRRGLRLDDAEASYRQTLGLMRQHRPEDRNIAAVLQNLGHMLALMLDRPDEGRPMLLEALARKEARSGKDSKSLVTTLSSLGSLELKQGDAPACEAYFRRVLAIQRATEYPDPVITGQAWQELGRSLRAQDHPTEAEDALARALEIYASLERDEKVTEIRSELEQLLTEQGGM